MNLKGQRDFERDPSSSSRRSDTMDRARDVLIGSSQSGSMSTQPLPYNDGNGSVGTTIEIHRRLFGYRQATPHLNFELPRKASVTSSQACGSRSYKGKGKHRLMSSAAWRPARTEKSCTICLKWKPWAVERIRGLAKIGLGLPAELTFDHDGDAEHISEHIHSVLVSQFTQLETCAGYTLLPLKDNSHDLVEIRPVRATITLYPIGRPVRATITLYPIGRPVRATIILYPIGRPVRAIITLYPIGRPVRAIITLYPIGRPVRATITLYPIGRPVRATITLYPIGRPVRATITLYPIGRPVRATITLYPIGRPVRATITLYPIGRPVRATITLYPIGRPVRATIL